MAKFKARALDLLERQHIAGIPTAINESFKNAAFELKTIKFKGRQGSGIVLAQLIDNMMIFI